jgi:hypothetical protein
MAHERRVTALKSKILTHCRNHLGTVSRRKTQMNAFMQRNIADDLAQFTNFANTNSYFVKTYCWITYYSSILDSFCPITVHRVGACASGLPHACAWSTCLGLVAEHTSGNLSLNVLLPSLASSLTATLNVN